MTMRNKAANLRKNTKKVYTKPELNQIPLRPEESVLGFCKNTNTYGPIIYHCQIIVSCWTIGS